MKNNAIKSFTTKNISVKNIPNKISTNKVFLLYQDNIALAECEVKSLLMLDKYSLEKYVIISAMEKNCENKILRLAYTRYAFDLLFECALSQLEGKLENFVWKRIYKKDFCLRIRSIDSKKEFEEKTLAGYVWRNLAKNKITPKVNLENAETFIEIILLGKKAYVCKLIWQNKEDFESRKAHLKPVLIPTAMMPKMARALVNIVRADNIIDPFCGAGGILVEAGLIGVKSKGYDIDKKVLAMARESLNNEKINKKMYMLKIQDATKLKNLKNIVTDLPYGKSSKMSDQMDGLYSKFIKNISGRSVIVFPDWIDFRKILKNNLNKKLKVEKIIDCYVHKSLTRKIVVIDK